MSSREAANYPATMPAVGETVPYVADIQPENENRPITDEGYHGGEFRNTGRMAWRVPRPRVDSVGPVSPQYYYVRPEYTPQGYIPGQYGRIDNFTPGQYTPHGYEQGHYRADGLYTRPEYTPQGYIPGHWRADPMPFGQATPAVTPSSPAHR